ncbi:hypothetical protein ACOMHN_039890 [Nucella lapillus]
MDCLFQACNDFGLTISLKKADIFLQGRESPRVITIEDYELEVLTQFTYSGSTISSNLSSPLGCIRRNVGIP